MTETTRSSALANELRIAYIAPHRAASSVTHTKVLLGIALALLLASLGLDDRLSGWLMSSKSAVAEDRYLADVQLMLSGYHPHPADSTPQR